MSRLAWVAVVLMLCAPLLSRALQSPGMPRLVELCTSAGMQRVDLATLAPPVSPHAGHAAPLPGPDAPDGHAAHGGEAAACDYCLLAIRLLPLFACLVLMLAWRAPTRPQASRPAAFVTAFAWPAHAARGPPLYA
ncbi:DUF2946 family protein [Stenotrophomonas sp. HITSZ_GD]|uniref:DUF2946 family protein n=1 Tax=Stenotrophomonas sp. HITSZ_GD TaxID=3037248 RepID=UPI00240DF78C|nr:DUF2946 family protein [Stenotrophomonas sp. HITSZ_GD]MDG2525761.1 DUF2946 family protein [Stenotrophomonas sp. HITSZ_GD]